MHKLRNMLTLVCALALASCQTVVNGVDVREQAWTCGWQCVALGLAGAVGVGMLVAGGGDSGGGRSPLPSGNPVQPSGPPMPSGAGQWDY